MKELPKEFFGIGEARGDSFKQINESPFAFIYERANEYFTAYEVFIRKETKDAVAIMDGIEVNFEAKVRYPKAEDFGVWAWYYTDYNKSVSKFNELNTKLLDDKRNKESTI